MRVTTSDAGALKRKCRDIVEFCIGKDNKKGLCERQEGVASLNFESRSCTKRDNGWWMMTTFAKDTTYKNNPFCSKQQYCLRFLDLDSRRILIEKGGHFTCYLIDIISYNNVQLTMQQEESGTRVISSCIQLK